jgi:RNA polymerase sigma-70 factor (ECF subfamily)
LYTVIVAGLDDNAVASAYQQAKACYPGVDVPRDAFDASLASTLGSERLADLHTSDLYLALGCLRGDPLAIAALEATVFAEVRPSLERICRDGEVPVDDVLQWTREKLLVRSPSNEGAAEPKLQQYTGRGSLLGWVRVVAVREALQARRKSKRERVRDDAAMLEGGEPGTDVELALLRERYASSFRTAVELALRSLTPEQRSILRFHTCDGLTIDQLAPMLGVHRATAARRLEKARTDALMHVRQLIREKHGLSESEARSLCTVLGREVDVSIGRALQEVGA